MNRRNFLAFFPPVALPAGRLDPAVIQTLRVALEGLTLVSEAKQLRLKSRDFHWYSPILKEQLGDCVADLVVMPKSESEVVRIAAAVARHRVPLTIRGGGTGNYGQSVPLQGGLVLDTTRMDRMLSVASGSIRVQAGAKIAAALAAAEATGQQLLMYPSTLRVATVAGFVAGGRGGIGSVRHGILKESGALRSVRVVTVEERPQVITLTGSEVEQVHHAWGTNGVITEVELALVPAGDWVQCIATFDRYGDVLRFGLAAMADELGLFLLTAVDGRFKPFYEQFGDYFSGGGAMFAIVERAHVDRFFAVAARFDGKRSLAMDKKEVEDRGLPQVYECAFNHTTLRALKVDPGWTYLQHVMPMPFDPALVERQIERYGDEILMHHEFTRLDGRPRVSCLPLVRYTSAQRLDELMRDFATDGCAIMNPHTFLRDASDVQPRDDGQRAFKALADPLGLMNPGK
jgi:FAD/FMN-containing dehydrogenase